MALTTISEGTQTDGNFRAKAYKFTVNANTTTSYDFSYPYNIEILSACFYTKNSTDGDKIRCLVAPNTITGTVTEQAPITQNWIKVAQTVIDNCKVGYMIKIASNSAEYFVLAIDKTNLKLTVDRNLENQAEVNDYVKQSVVMMQDFYVHPDKFYEIGDKKLGGSFIPKDKVIRVEYTTTALTAFEFQFWIELLY